MLLASLAPCGVSEKRIGRDAELSADKGKDFLWDQFAGCQRPTWIAKRAEL